MENFDNKNKDAFEEFLRKTLDSYEEMPSDKVWDAIQPHTPKPLVVDEAPSPTVEPRLTTLKWTPYLMAASVLFLVSLAIGQYVFFQKKINDLQAEVRSQKAELWGYQAAFNKKNEETNLLFDSLKALQTEITAIQSAQSADENSDATAFSKKKQTQSSLSIGSKSTTAQVSPIGKTHESAIVSVLPTVGDANLRSDGLNAQLAQNNSIESRNQAINTKDSSQNQSNTSLNGSGQVSFLPTLANPSALFSQSNEKILTQITQGSFPKIASTSIRKIWLTQTVGMADQSLELNKDRRGFPKDHSAQQYEKSGFATQTNLMLERSLSKNNRWSLVAGLGFGQITQEANQTLEVKPKSHSGGGGPGGPSNDSLDFNFSIQTGIGVADVELRASTTSTGGQFPKDLEVTTTTTEKSQFIAVPVHIKYIPIRKKTLQVFASAGLQMNIPLRKFLEVTDFEVRGAPDVQADKRFRDHPSFRSNSGGSVDWMVSASVGLEWQATPRVSLSISPQWGTKLNSGTSMDWATHRLNLQSLQLGLGYTL